ncbi:Aste57867_21493 [Aphanomyces stellatus]|uniref:Aste57867_21493 protein n=1 Tax=Aphanomyces stellatus TaxID=120398 RepID=A0A485LHP8_9STRA|nr:hypothetical protein As57867_021424 [Aphanomyces stellatus]VFT98163.1 Aste57867_21493 [Aphanomyces stellatus]
MGKQRTKAAPAPTRSNENKRGSLVLSGGGGHDTKTNGASLAKWTGLAMLHAEHEATLDERKKTLIANVPVLGMVVNHGIAEADLMDALKPLAFKPDEVIVKQGDVDTRLYFVESGSVVISKTIKGKTHDEKASSRDEYEYFGATCEYPFVMHGEATRSANVTAINDVRCFYMELPTCMVLLKSVQTLLRFRFLMREHGVLDNLNVFSALNPKQRGRMLDLTTLHEYADGDYICKQGELDDQYFVLVEVGHMSTTPTKVDLTTYVPQGAAAKISIRKDGVDVELARKLAFQGFGEMGLFGKARTADVIAVGPVTCIVMNRESFVAAQNIHMDGDAEAMLATNLANEWDMQRHIEALHENPKVVAYLSRFIRRFKSSQNAKFLGKTLYSDLFRRVFHNPKLALEFPSISNKIDWFDATSAMKAIRFEAKRLMTKEPNKTLEELAFVGRLTDSSALLDKFRISDAPNTPEQKFYMAMQLAKIMEFISVKAGKHIFRQNVIEGKAYVVLSGLVHVVLEDNHNATKASAPPNIIASLVAGDSLGELSLVTNMARSASAVAGTDTELILIERRNFAKFFASRPGFKIRHYIIERADFIERLSYFSKYDHKSCIRVAYDMAEGHYSARHVFVAEGAHASTFYILKEGQVAVYKAKADASDVSMHVSSLGPRECFGLSTLQSAAVEVSTYVAMTPVVALELVDTKVRRLEVSVQDQIRTSLHARADHETRMAATMLERGTALFVKTKAPWCPMGQGQTPLERHMGQAYERRNTSCTRVMYQTRLDVDVRVEGGGETRSSMTSSTTSAGDELPCHTLPTSSTTTHLLGSFLSKTLQSFHAQVAPQPATATRRSPPRLYHEPLTLIQSDDTTHDVALRPVECTTTTTVGVPRHYRRKSVVDVSPLPRRPSKASSGTAPDDNNDGNGGDLGDDDAAQMWKLDRTITENLYL